MKLVRPHGLNPHFLMLTEEQLFFIEANQKELVWYIKTAADLTKLGVVKFLPALLNADVDM